MLQADDGDVAGRRPAEVDPVAGLRRARAATLLLLALPGSAYLYQGEELGLPEVIDLAPEVRQDPAFHRAAGQDGYRDGCRVPIPWDGDRAPYGFGPAGGGSWLPQPASWARLSVAAQQGDPASTLELYRAALALRRAQPALGAADNLRWCEAPAGLLVFERGAAVRCTVNMTGEPIRIPRPGEALLTSGPVDLDGADAVIPADTTVWWSVR
jgi:alpha-glucosidase